MTTQEFARDDAAAFCQSEGGLLVSLDDGFSIASVFPPDKTFWIGLEAGKLNLQQ